MIKHLSFISRPLVSTTSKPLFYYNAAPAKALTFSLLRSRSLATVAADPEVCKQGKLTVSHVIGPSFPPLYENSTGRLAKDLAATYGDLPALVSVHQDVRLTYAELDRKSDILAVNVARQLGVVRGDRVAVCSGNLWEYLVLQLGLAKIGAVMVPLNPAFTDTQFHTALNNAQAKVLVIQSHLSRGPRKTSKDVTGLIRAATDGNLLPSISKVVILDSLMAPPPDAREKIELDGDVLRPFDCLMKWYSAEDPALAPELAHLQDKALDRAYANEVINMQFTSGTTAMPKIASLTHRNLVNNGDFIGRRMGLTAYDSHHPGGQDKLCVPVPMFHCFGLILGNLATLSQGACLVYASETFDARSTMQAIRQESCTGLLGVPTMYISELELEDELALGGHELLRKGIAAGTSIPIELMSRLIRTLHLDALTICYGMTETSPVSFMTSPADTLQRRCESVGTIMPHTEAMVIPSAPESATLSGGDLDLTPVPVGEKGEVIVSGYLLQQGYHNAPDKTAEAMIYDANGKRWMRTGDEGVIDSHGYLRISGRLKDLIIRGGENIHPLEIENVLFRHKAVSQVSVVGVPDAKYGEAVAAFVQLHDQYHARHGRAQQAPSVEELKSFVGEHLGHQMTPKHIWFVPDMPKTASGKIRKVDLKGTALSLLDGSN